MSMLGADISAMQRTLDLGYKYYDSNGVQKDPYDLLKAAGANYARFRVWNAPPSNYNNKTKVLQSAAAAKNTRSIARNAPVASSDSHSG